MKSKLLWFIMLLVLTGSAKGQTAYSYRYWFDNDDMAVHTGSASGETTIEIDISTLAKGSVHALHLQGLDARNKWSTVRTQYFFITDWRESDTQSATARYWFDDDETTALTASTVHGTINLDIAGLDYGIHSVHYQTFNAKGDASPVHTQYFYKKNELARDNMSCRLWIDDKEDDAMSFGLMDDIIIMAADLVAGTHELHVVVLNAEGEELAEGMTTFEVDALRSITITLQAPIATFSNEHSLDFGGIEGIKAYTATSFHKWTGNVLMSRVDDVPAGEGLLLVGEPGTYEVPVLQSYSYYANLLVGTPEATVIAQTAEGFDNYLLSFRDGEAGFFLADDGSTLAAGKAYLHVPSAEAAGARRLKISFDDNPDAVASPLGETKEEAMYYNVSGQRIHASQRGLNIIRMSDGTRKVIMK